MAACAFGQETSDVPSCSVAHNGGRRIVSQLEIVEFYVPRFAHLTKSRDVDYVEYFVRYGPKGNKSWLKFMFGEMVGGVKPSEVENRSIQWTAQEWGCHHDKDGTDWRGVAEDGRKWRHISVPFGFAAYEGMPPKAAEYFDKILDSMCCGKCPTCKK